MASQWYPVYFGDYIRDTADLPLIQHGAYWLLLGHFYTTRRAIPPESRYRVAHAHGPEECAAVDAVLAQFWELMQGGYVQKRAALEIQKAQQREDRGRSGALGRWGQFQGNDRDRAKRSDRLAEARAKGVHTEQEWEALLEIVGTNCLKCGGLDICKDHIIPIYLGGSDGIDNLQPLCVACNSGKGPDSTDYRPAQWRARLLERLPSACLKPAERLPPHPHPHPLPDPEPQRKEKDQSAPKYGAGQERDPIWDTLLEVCGVKAGDKITSSARGAYNKSVKDLKAVAATPDEIRRRARAFAVRWGDKITPTALVRRWNECTANTSAPATKTPKQIADEKLAEDVKRAGVEQRNWKLRPQMKGEAPENFVERIRRESADAFQATTRKDRK